MDLTGDRDAMWHHLLHMAISLIIWMEVEDWPTLSANWELEQTLRGKSVIDPIFVGILRSIELGASSEIEG